MIRKSLYFTAPGKVSLLEETISLPEADQVLVQTILSAISPGTEMLIYRGQFPAGIAIDDTIGDLAGSFGYPLKYGYSTVGRVIAAGSSVQPGWEGRQVFAFHPHESLFSASPTDLVPLPENVSPQDAVFLPNVETAVNFLMDGQPMIGEQIAIFGQGIVGLLATALLARFPLSRLVTLDKHLLRRQASVELGAQECLDPDSPDSLERLNSLFDDGADLVYELSGSPQALDQAIAVTGFAGRLVVGSWYGDKRATLDLGSRFHRSRIRLISSQVSSLAPELTGRWDKTRRLQVALDLLPSIRPSRFITHRFPLNEAANAYRLLDQDPGSAIQVLLEHCS